jgi:hypothetical protein
MLLELKARIEDGEVGDLAAIAMKRAKASAFGTPTVKLWPTFITGNETGRRMTMNRLTDRQRAITTTECLTFLTLAEGARRAYTSRRLSALKY